MKERMLEEFARIWDRYFYIQYNKYEKDGTLKPKSEDILNQCEIEMNLLTRLTDNDCNTSKF